MDEDTIAMLNAPNNDLIGQFIHQHPMGPIIWEQTRYHAEITAMSGPVVVVSRAPYWGPRGARCNWLLNPLRINYKTNKTLHTLNKVASQKKQ